MARCNAGEKIIATDRITLMESTFQKTSLIKKNYFI